MGPGLIIYKYRGKTGLSHAEIFALNLSFGVCVVLGSLKAYCFKFKAEAVTGLGLFAASMRGEGI